MIFGRVENKDSILLRIPKGIKISKPYRDASKVQHTLIIMEEGSQLTYINEGYSKSIEVHVAPGAVLSFLNLSRDYKDLYSNTSFSFSIRENATAHLLFIDLGRDLLKREIRVQLLGDNALSNIRGIYILEGNESLEHHIIQEHRAPFTTSNLIYRGILKDNARGIFKGEITVKKEAKQSDAYQINHILILGENPSIDTVPILEIETNDLRRCTHGTTVGRIDEEILFYTKARGLDDKDAIKLISMGFLGEILEEIPIKEEVTELIEEKLEVNV